jgi:two-component system, NtrC family, C4-dicarboxylate transport sensor histidine kinase DctB
VVRGSGDKWADALPWLLGLLFAPVWLWLATVLPVRTVYFGVIAISASALTPVPGLVLFFRRNKALAVRAAQAADEIAQLRFELDSIRFRTARLREDLSAADRQARLSHQLSILGQFTAGFMHEFNNPLSIVTSRIEILLDERKDDEPLCADLRQMLLEARYMANIARTLLQALRRERGSEGFDPSIPSKALQEAVLAQTPAAEEDGVRVVLDIGDVPRVNVPEHVISEVVRGLITNALQALRGRQDPIIWLRLDPYHAGGSKVVLHVEDNGPGVPESIRAHLFEPFTTQSSGRERLGLGLFLAASLLDMYEGRLRYETRDGGGASFVVEMPPARFLRGQPYHWFVMESSREPDPGN